jgi:hypothetical protein
MPIHHPTDRISPPLSCRWQRRVDGGIAALWRSAARPVSGHTDWRRQQAQFAEALEPLGMPAPPRRRHSARRGWRWTAIRRVVGARSHLLAIGALVAVIHLATFEYVLRPIGGS